MRTSPLPAIAIAALLVLAGCAGLPGAGDSAPSPEAFPDASAIDQSVYERHAALLANTSFTVRFENTEQRPHPIDTENLTWMNSSRRVLVDTGDSQYLSQPNGTLNYLGTTTIQQVYSNGSSAYALRRGDGESTVESVSARTFNESGDYYLWRGWRELNGGPGGLFFYLSENVTFERRGIETVEGVNVMRYEADGTDALTGRLGDVDSLTYADFSVTLLLDADGVIRYYRAEVDITRDLEGVDRMRNETLVATVTDVGSTDVEKPDWVVNATAGS